jgi:transposase
MTRPRVFTREFKSDAVKLYRESGKSMNAVATSLGVDRTTLRAWLRQFEAGGESALIHGPPEKIERAEIRELKRKLAEAEMERDVLKKRWRTLRKRSGREVRIHREGARAVPDPSCHRTPKTGHLSEGAKGARRRRLPSRGRRGECRIRSRLRRSTRSSICWPTGGPIGGSPARSTFIATRPRATRRADPLTRIQNQPFRPPAQPDAPTDRRMHRSRSAQ